MLSSWAKREGQRQNASTTGPARPRALTAALSHEVGGPAQAKAPTAPAKLRAQAYSTHAARLACAAAAAAVSCGTAREPTAQAAATAAQQRRRTCDSAATAAAAAPQPRQKRLLASTGRAVLTARTQPAAPV